MSGANISEEERQKIIAWARERGLKIDGVSIQVLRRLWELHILKNVSVKARAVLLGYFFVQRYPNLTIGLTIGFLEGPLQGTAKLFFWNEEIHPLKIGQVYEVEVSGSQLKSIRPVPNVSWFNFNLNKVSITELKQIEGEGKFFRIEALVLQKNEKEVRLCANCYKVLKKNETVCGRCGGTATITTSRFSLEIGKDDIIWAITDAINPEYDLDTLELYRKELVMGTSIEALVLKEKFGDRDIFRITAIRIVSKPLEIPLEGGGTIQIPGAIPVQQPVQMVSQVPSPVPQTSSVQQQTVIQQPAQVQQVTPYSQQIQQIQQPQVSPQTVSQQTPQTQVSIPVQQTAQQSQTQNATLSPEEQAIVENVIVSIEKIKDMVPEVSLTALRETNGDKIINEVVKILTSKGWKYDESRDVLLPPQ